MSEKIVVDRQHVAEGIQNEIRYICKTFGSRETGSQGEADAADYMRQKLEKYADDVKTENFKAYPKAYMGWVPLSATFMILAYVAYFFCAMLAIVFVIASLLPYLIQYIFNLRVMDVLYKEKTSQNVTAVRRSSDETQKRIFFVAHIDAAHEMTVKHYLGGAMFTALRVLNFAGALYVVALSVAKWALFGGIGAGIASGGLLYAGLAGAIFLFPWISTYFLVSPKRVIDGANDGLSGVLTAYNVIRFLKKQDVTLKNTEVGVILTGGGAAGVQGAKAWAEAHKGEYGDETVFVSLNLLRELNCLNVDKGEMFGFSKGDPEVAQLVLKAAEEIDIPCKNRMNLHCASDCAPLVQAGMKGASVNAISSKLPDYFRTRYDSYDNLSEDCLGACFELALQIVKDFSGEDIQFEFLRPQAEPSEEDIPVEEPLPEEEGEAPTSDAYDGAEHDGAAHDADA